MSIVNGSKIKLFQLRAFVAVVEQGSFGKAAVELELTQSAISHAIAGLETELGVVLFTRGQHGATLTPIGSEIVDHARQMLQHLEQLVNKTQQVRGLEAGQVRVAAIRSLATHWLPQLIAAFKQRYPKIQVTMTRCMNHGEVQAALENGTADVGLMDIFRPQRLDVYELFTDDYIALLPTDAPRRPTAKTDAEFWGLIQSYPLILPLPSDNSYTLLREYLAKLPVKLRVAYELNEDSAIVSMVAEGLGMTILPYLAAIPIPKEVRIWPLPQPLKRKLGAVLLADGLHSPAIYAFLEMAQQLAAGVDTQQDLSGR
ncbi:MAG: LysR family transcriptional regulator [Thainema sp.]